MKTVHNLSWIIVAWKRVTLTDLPELLAAKSSVY